jgi:hypothetical protein
MSLTQGNVKKKDISLEIMAVCSTVTSLSIGSDVRKFVGFDTLLVRDINKSSAMQRAGRAGREVCVSRIHLEERISFLRREEASVFAYILKRLSTQWRSLLNRKSVGVV